MYSSQVFRTTCLLGPRLLNIFFYPVPYQCFILNSTARFTGGDVEGFGGESKMIGDATETGMVRFAAARLLGNEDVEGFRDNYPKVT